ncbi:MAG: large conductance mechanosensitive channel protein MscL [Caldisericia bacterium]|nr:large conductance mechanosensitive channel protein MscL [Caldisericia bacterium]
MWKEFKEFALKGNVIDLAVGLIIGAAFGTIVKSLVDDIIMPLIGQLVGKVDFANLYILISEGKTPGPYSSLVDAKTAGAVTWNYGSFINTIVNFIIIAFSIFMVIKLFNKLKKQPKPAEVIPTTKECPYCFSTIPIKATRCPNCTSELK